MKNTILLVATLLLALATPCLAAEHQRDSWYIGVGLGGSVDETVTVSGQDNSFDDMFAWSDTSSPVAINFKVGKTYNDRNLLGFDITALGQSGTVPILGDVHVQINNYFFMWTHFPFEEGFFTRLGGGLSAFVLDDDGDTESYGGAGLLVGIGHALWLGKSFNLTLNLDYSYQSYSGSAGPDSSDFLIYYVGFDWY